MPTPTMSTPDITKAQILAGITWIISQAVAAGWIDNNTAMLVTQIAGTGLAIAWVLGDAIIRHGRSRVFQNPPKPATDDNPGT